MSPRQTTGMCPYNTYPASSFWSKTVAAGAPSDLDPMSREVSMSREVFRISKTDKVATAGSCFAQHIARRLAKSGYNFFVTEQAPKIIPEDIAHKFGFGVFSARFGNVYTARQLLQLLERAYGRFVPVDDAWEADGGLVDPYRPFVQPMPFSSRRALEADRARHFAAVRAMFEQCNVFVFTLGLTEAWISRSDGAVYPVCPGCGAGRHHEDAHLFKNFDYEEVLSDMRAFISRFKEINPTGRLLLTVSPVPLIATAESQHVLVSTIYSKSVLRAVAGKLDSLGVATYFPSYEIITNQRTAGLYFENDCRNVNDAGVSHVMAIFFRHMCDETEGDAPLDPAADVKTDAYATLSTDQLDRFRAICDEEKLMGTLDR